ncbi:ABC transporter permease [Aridibaculum aurantiacum]|uniref:ABC transporter permease n=1 Tax=Aridibaculum aurantiacum TaxID=2810307 RepID=UPI001F617518|nr:ABC transporter permease [Aridibaculum aurantiacum]
MIDLTQEKVQLEKIEMQEEKPQPKWTEILTPKSKLLDLKLKEVWRYRDLLFLFVKRDFKAQYRQTILGPLWHVIQPVFTTLIFLVIFNNLAKIPTDGIPAILFYMSSLTIWNYFAACLTSTSNTFVANAGIFGKVYFPRLVLPLSIVMSNMVKFGIQLGLLIIVYAYYLLKGEIVFSFGPHLLLMPAIAVVMAMLGLGMGIIISSVTTKYRDVAVLIQFGVQLLMYITPVAYPLSYAMESKYRGLMLFNPLSSLVEGFRYSIFGTGTVDVGLATYSIGFAVVAVLIGIILFNKVERSFMDTV